MKDMETFIINIRSTTTDVYNINININEIKHYKNLKMFVKDFIVINDEPITGDISPNIYTLNSDTLILNNNYDNHNESFATNTAYGVLKSGSTVLASITVKHPYTSNNNESYYKIQSINGTHRFWIEDYFTTSRFPAFFYVSLVVVAYN